MPWQVEKNSGNKNKAEYYQGENGRAGKGPNKDF
jgi:hypothetical protein